MHFLSEILRTNFTDPIEFVVPYKYYNIRSQSLALQLFVFHKKKILPEMCHSYTVHVFSKKTSHNFVHYRLTQRRWQHLSELSVALPTYRVWLSLKAKNQNVILHQHLLTACSENKFYSKGIHVSVESTCSEQEYTMIWG